MDDEDDVKVITRKDLRLPQIKVPSYCDELQERLSQRYNMAVIVDPIDYNYQPIFPDSFYELSEFDFELKVREPRL